MGWALAATSVFILATAAFVAARRRHVQRRRDRAAVVRAALARAKAKQRSLGRDVTALRAKGSTPPAEER